MLVLLAFSGCQNNHQNLDERFHGMWRLDKFETLDTVSGKWIIDSTRIGYNGFILYDGKGHMGVQITPSGYKDLKTDRNIDSLNNKELKELIRFYQSNMVYLADYKITDKTIHHIIHTANDPRDWGTTVIRDFEFRKDTLILTPHERRGNKRIVRLRWIKL